MPTSRDLADADPSPAVAEIVRQLEAGRRLVNRALFGLLVGGLFVLAMVLGAR
jgi:hypothetical protein